MAALFVLQGVMAAAARATLYVPDASAGRVHTAGLDGSNPQYTDALPVGGGFASDGAHLFYAVSSDVAPSIGRASSDTSGADNAFISVPKPACGSLSSTPFVSAIAISGAQLVWADSANGTVGKASTDGTSVSDQLVVTSGGSCGQGGEGPLGVAADGAHVYWSNPDQGTIGQVGLDGSNPNPNFVTGAARPTGVAMSGANLYWLNAKAGADGSATIGHALLDAQGALVPGSVNENFIGPVPDSFGDAVGLAAVDNQLFFDGGDGWVGRAAVDGSAVNPHLVQLGAAGDPIAADGDVADATTQSIVCKPSTLQLLDPGPAPDVDVDPPLRDTTRCTVAVRDTGPTIHTIEGAASLSQTPIVGDLFSSCTLAVTVIGQGACTTTLQTDSTADGYRRSDSVTLASSYPGDLTHQASSAHVVLPVQRVRPCGLTRDAEIHFYAWLCPGNSRTPLVQHETTVRLSSGTVQLTTPYWCDAALTPISAMVSFHANRGTRTRVRRVVFSIPGRRAKTSRHAPFRAAFSISIQAARGRAMRITARVTLSRGSSRAATVRVALPHC